MPQADRSTDMPKPFGGDSRRPVGVLQAPVTSDADGSSTGERSAPRGEAISAPATYSSSRPRMESPGHAVRTDPIDHVTGLRHAEGYVRIGLSVFIVLFVVVLIVFDPALSEAAKGWTQAVLAFALAALTTSMTGALHVEGRLAGLAIRGTAGFAVFLIVWFTLPKAVTALNPQPQASLRISRIPHVDFRVFADPATEEGGGGRGPIAITVPLRAVASSPFSGAQPAIIEHVSLIVDFGDGRQSLPWLWFVDQYRDSSHPRREWLSATGRVDVAPIAVEAGKPVSRELISDEVQQP